jgi:hypothetical protein
MMFDSNRAKRRLAGRALIALAGLTMFAFTATPAGAENRVAQADKPREETHHKKSEPIVINISDVSVPEFRELCPAKVIKEKKCKGDANLTINPDGTWNFTGSFPWSEQGSHMDFVMGVRDSRGTLIIFTASPLSTAEGYIWNKQGKNQTIKDNFSAFEGGYHWYWKSNVGIIYDHPASGGGGPNVGNIIGDVAKALGVAASVAAAVL